MFISCNRLGRPEQIFFGGDVQPVIKYRDEIGQPLLHSYEVYNAGPWKVPYLSVVILWPYQVENGKPVGKWLLYMDEKPKVDGNTGINIYLYIRLLTLDKFFLTLQEMANASWTQDR